VTIGTNGLSNYRVVTTAGRRLSVVDYGMTSALPVHLPFRLVMGKEWDSSVWAKVYNTNTRDLWRLHGKVEKKERITVPAGSFEAVRVVTMVLWQGKLSTTTAWYAPGVGQVKFWNVVGDWRHDYVLQGARVGNRVYGTFTRMGSSDQG